MQNLQQEKHHNKPPADCMKPHLYQPDILSLLQKTKTALRSSDFQLTTPQMQELNKLNDCQQKYKGKYPIWTWKLPRCTALSINDAEISHDGKSGTAVLTSKQDSRHSKITYCKWVQQNYTIMQCKLQSNYKAWRRNQDHTAYRLLYQQTNNSSTEMIVFRLIKPTALPNNTGLKHQYSEI